MKFKKEKDNRYWVRFMRATEKLMRKLTVSQFISYLKENAELEGDDYECIDDKHMVVKVYLLNETESLSKEFLVTEDGRVFYCISLNTKVELVDDVLDEDKGMKIYKNENDTVRVGAEKREGKYIIIVEKVRKFMVATKGTRKPHIEEDINHFEKEFSSKEQANRYFLGIKRNNPTLKLI